MVNWCELTTTDEQGKVLYHNAWATSHLIAEHNVEHLAQAGRARWKIENEGNNTLKTIRLSLRTQLRSWQTKSGQPARHHDPARLPAHTTLDWIDQRYRMVRRLLPSRRTFFEHVRALLLYLPFDDWDHLMRFMLKKLTPPDTG
jgi:hypothetical protein